MKFCPRLLIFQPLDCTLGIFRGYDFSIFQILLFLDRYFRVFDSDLRASPSVCLVMECPPGLDDDAMFYKNLFVSVSVKQNLVVTVFVCGCMMMLDDVGYTGFFRILKAPVV